MQRIALIRNKVSKYGVLGAMTDSLASAFTRLGIEVSVYDPDTAFEKICDSLPDCTWGINVFLGEDVFFRPFGIPHVNLSVDTLLYSPASALNAPHSTKLFVDNSSCEIMKSLGSEKTLWFPHAIARETIDEIRPLPLNERPYDVSLIGSYFPKGEEIPPPLSKLIEQGLESLSFPFLQRAIEAVKTSAPLKLCALEIALRRADRERIIKVLRGRQIHIFTGIEDAATWAKEEPDQHYSFHPPADFREAAKLCCLSKVVINSSPHLRPGYHERLFLSLASGAITLVERGRLPSWLVEEGRVVEYDSASLESVPGRLIEAQRRPYNREKVLTWLSSEHTWDARLQNLLPKIERLIAS